MEIQSINDYARQCAARSGLVVIKQRLLRGRRRPSAREPGASVIHSKDGPLGGYYHALDAVVPVHWMTDEIYPSVARAIATYGLSDTMTA